MSLTCRFCHCLSGRCRPCALGVGWSQEDGVNDVGPMITQEMIGRTEILRPDSALIPSNEAEKPRCLHTRTHAHAHTHTCQCIRTCVRAHTHTMASLESTQRLCSVMGGQELWCAEANIRVDLARWLQQRESSSMAAVGGGGGSGGGGGGGGGMGRGDDAKKMPAWLKR